ncbi:hypothetical protein Tco_1250426 [Tanacetum coccineum]
MNIILLGLSNDFYSPVDSCASAFDMWKAIEWQMQGTKVGLQEKELIVLCEYEKFTSVQRETIASYYLRFARVINNLNKNKLDLKNIMMNITFLLKEANDIKAELERRKHDPLAHVAHTPLAYNSHAPLSSPMFSPATYITLTPAYNASSYAAPCPTYTTTIYSPPKHAYSQVDYASLPPEYSTPEATRVIEHVEIDPMHDLNTALSLLSRAITRNYSTATDNIIRTSSNIRNPIAYTPPTVVAPPRNHAPARQMVLNVGMSRILGLLRLELLGICPTFFLETLLVRKVVDSNVPPLFHMEHHR